MPLDASNAITLHGIECWETEPPVENWDINGGSTAVRKILCAYEDRLDLRDALLDNGGDAYPPDAALRVLTVPTKGVGNVGIGTGDIAVAELAELTVNYGIPEGDEFLEDEVGNIDMDFSASVLQLPSDRPVFRWPSGQPVAASQTAGFRLITQALWLDLRNLNLGSGGGLDQAMIRDFLDSVNELECMGADPGHLLFHGVRSRHRILRVGSTKWQAGFAWTWRNKPWNQMLNPTTGEWEEIVTIAGGNTLHHERDHNLLIAP